MFEMAIIDYREADWPVTSSSVGQLVPFHGSGAQLFYVRRPFGSRLSAWRDTH